MKIFGVAVAALLAAGAAWALQGKPINETCPVKGEKIKGVTTTYKGKTIGFC
jgi:hypothetical protein